MNLREASEQIRHRKVSPVELTQDCLRRIERLGPELNAFITVTAESALDAALVAEREIQAGTWRGPLHGLPIALKDLIDTAGVRTTAASALFQDRIPEHDAEIVARLKTAGAIILGKLNLHEFAYGGTSAISFFGPVRNPWNPAYSPGGSSGGSAAAVAASVCFGAIGTDTGGSIREPAAYCGIVGFKPTYSSVSSDGVIPLSKYLDHVGPMTRTVEDAGLLLSVIAETPQAATTELRTLRVGIPRDFFYAGLDPQVQSAVENALAVLRKICPAQQETPPLADDGTYASLMEPYATVLRAEAYSFHKEYVTKSPELYQPTTLRRILSGADVSPGPYADSRARLDHLRATAASYFQNIDLVVTPTAPILPLTIAELVDADTARPLELQMLRNTRPFNALGLPAISVPCGFSDRGFPIGLQIAGRPGGDSDVLALARAYEQATKWHLQTPKLP
jgi:aspartyl-tRNA(Asn)/glutamyl-tRNA(Gln) amidotransferase subunit A